jgi:hypothetical protein
MDPLEVIQVRVLNQYAFLLPLIIIVDSIRDLVFGLTINFFVLYSFGAILLFTFFFTKLRFNTFLVVFCCFFIAGMIFYFSSVGGADNGIFLNYFGLLSGVLFIFNGKHAVTLGIILYIFIYVLFCIGNIYNFEIFTIPEYKNVLMSKNIRMITFSQVFVIMAFNGFFIIRKNVMTSNLYHEKLKADGIVSEYKKKLHTSNAANIEDIVKLAMDDDIAFIPQFKQFFSNLYMNLEKANPGMTPDEFKFCAMLKLGFSTKDISQYTHTTIRSVQTRKNRFRKSFNIPSETDLYKWIDAF